MRIMVTNDDGIHAEGLDVCEKIAREISDDVWVIAPEYDQSGVAHSLSLNDPLRLRQVAERRYAVRGTPTDCVIMGARHVLNGKNPDLVLSGVNRGRNVGEDVIYSGTVAGAVEGTMIGVPSVALSQATSARTGRSPYWDTSLRFAPDIIKRVVAEGIPRDVLINVNFPDCPPEQVKGIEVTAQGAAARSACRSMRGRMAAAIRITGSPMSATRSSRPSKGTDLAALEDSRIAVTPMKARHDRRAVHDQARRACSARRAEVSLRAVRGIGGLDGLRQRFRLKRLLQGRRLAIRLGHAALAVAGGEDKRQSAFDQNVDHRRNRLAVEIDVKNGDVELGLLGERQSLVDAAGFARKLAAEIGEHVLQQHADHQLILDHKDARSGDRTWHCRHTGIPCFTNGSRP